MVSNSRNEGFVEKIFSPDVTVTFGGINVWKKIEENCFH